MHHNLLLAGLAAFFLFVPMELNIEEPPICLFNSFWLLQKQLWQTYVSICSIFRALQGAVID